MSDQQEQAAVDTAAPEAKAPEAQHAPKPEPQQSAPQDVEQEPHWLKDRLERERAKAAQKVLQDLGAANVDDVKQALAELKAKRDAQKTVEEKAAEARAEAERMKLRAQELEQAIAARAQRELSSLTEEQRNAVGAIAGDDPAAQLKTIDALSPTWKRAIEQQREAQPPANTAPARNAPADSSTSPPDRKAEYQRLQSDNPFAAAQYLNRYRKEIFPNA